MNQTKSPESSPVNSDSQLDPSIQTSPSKRFPHQRVSRRPVVIGLGAALARVFLGPVSKVAEASPLHTPYIEPDKPLEDTSEGTEFVNDTFNKTASGKRLAEIKDLIVDKLRLGKLTKKVYLVNPGDPRLKVEQGGYGIYLDNSYKTEGTGGQAVFKEDGSAEIVIGFDPYGDQTGLIRHEQSHLLYPPFKVVNRFLSPEKTDKTNNTYEAFSQAYKARLAKGQYTTMYDMRISEGMYPKIGEGHWSYFLIKEGLGEYYSSAVPRAKMEEVARTSQNSTYKNLAQRFLQGAEPFLTRKDLAKLLGQGYWQEGEKFLAGTGTAFDNLKAQFDTLLSKAEVEAWADWGMLAFLHPQAVKDIFPEFYEAFSTAYQNIAGQTLEQASSLLTKPDEADIESYYRYRVSQRAAQEVMRDYFHKAFDLYNTGKLEGELPTLRTGLKEDVQKLNWQDQQSIAIAVELFIKNPLSNKNLLATLL